MSYVLQSRNGMSAIELRCRLYRTKRVAGGFAGHSRRRRHYLRDIRLIGRRVGQVVSNAFALIKLVRLARAVVLVDLAVRLQAALRKAHRGVANVAITHALFVKRGLIHIRAINARRRHIILRGKLVVGRRVGQNRVTLDARLGQVITTARAATGHARERLRGDDTANRSRRRRGKRI